MSLLKKPAYSYTHVMYSSLFAMRMLQVIDPYGADPRMRLGIEMAVDFIFAEFWFVYFHCFLSRRKEV